MAVSGFFLQRRVGLGQVLLALAQLLAQLGNALLVELLGLEPGLEFLMQTLQLGGQGGGTLLRPLALATFGLQFRRDVGQGDNTGPEAGFEFKDLRLKGRFALDRLRRGGRLALGLGELKLFGALSQLCFQLGTAGGLLLERSFRLLGRGPGGAELVGLLLQVGLGAVEILDVIRQTLLQFL